MRKVLILAALLTLSAGPSHADHCQDSTDWAGFTVPCHPKAEKLIQGPTFRASPDGPYTQEAIESGCGKLAPIDWTKFDECVREYSERRSDPFGGCERSDAQCMHKRLQELSEKGLLKRLPAPAQ